MNNISIGFVSGLVSAGVLFTLLIAIMQKQIILNDDFKYALYRIMIWGGVWALLFGLPILKNIIYKSLVIGLLVIFFNFLILMPMTGKGLFASNAGMSVFMLNIVFNLLWAVISRCYI